jgi:ribonuclease Z
VRIGFLGTGGALTSARRGHTSLVVDAGTLVLLDCSGTPPEALARGGFDWTTLEHVVLTHRHVDHVAGLPALVDELSIACRGSSRPPLRLWGPESALAVGRALLDAAGLLSREDAVALAFEPLPAAEATHSLGSLTLTSFPVAHGATPTLGLRLAPTARPEASLVYSSDTEPCRELLAQATQAALLVHECSDVERDTMKGHTTLAQLESLLGELEAMRLGAQEGRPVLASALESSPLPAVRLVHLPPLDAAAEREVEARLEARFDDAVRLAEDGLVIRL